MPFVHAITVCLLPAALDAPITVTSSSPTAGRRTFSFARALKNALLLALWCS